MKKAQGNEFIFGSVYENPENQQKEKVREWK